MDEFGVCDLKYGMGTFCEPYLWITCIISIRRLNWFSFETSRILGARLRRNKSTSSSSGSSVSLLNNFISISSLKPSSFALSSLGLFLDQGLGAVHMKQNNSHFYAIQAGFYVVSGIT